LDYSENDNWSDLKGDYINEFWEIIAETLNATKNEIIHLIMYSGSYMNNITTYLDECFAHIHWENDEYSMINEYLKQRAWRETPTSKLYIRALEKSPIGLFEVCNIKKGEYIDLKEYGYENIQRVYDKSISEKITKWKWIATRILTVRNRKILSASCLVFEADKIANIFTSIKLEREVIYQSLLAEKQGKSLDWDEKHINRMADIEAAHNFDEAILRVWIADIYYYFSNSTKPTLVNNDNDLLEDIILKFSIESKNKNKIMNKLYDATYLDCVDENIKWSWIGCDKNKIPALGTTLLGVVSLTEHNIKLAVNSTNRAKKGEAYLQELLGNMIAKPLILHKNIDDLLVKTISNQSDDNSIKVEHVEMITEVMDKHYRTILDEQIPVLNNKTPRECAKDKSLNAMLSQWLKGLESSTASMPQMQDYDFKWVWKELGMKYPNTKI